MTRRNWKRIRPNSLTEALRLCKEFAAERRNLSVERIADRMGTTHDSLYKWLATGRMPAILLPAYELACGCNFATVWLAASSGKLVIDMPVGRRGTTGDVVELNSSCAAALQLLTTFFAAPTEAGRSDTLAALSAHMEQVAYHQHNVAQYAAPELDFDHVS